LKQRTLLKTLFAGYSLALAQAEPWGADLPEQGPRFRIWDQHAHLQAVPGATPEARMALLVKCMDRLGIERLILSQGYAADEHPTPDQLREENDRVMRAVRAFPDRAFGSVYLSPAHLEFSLQEFDRCVRDGPMVMVGEIETDMRCNVPEMDPIAERAVALNVPILQHAGLITPVNPPTDSTPYDVVELARRHPKLQIVCAHTIELTVRMIRDTKNVYAGIAGGDSTAGITEMAVRELGAERVIYGSDCGGRSFASQVSKVLGADLPDSAKELILGGNLRRLLAPVLEMKGYKV
jgi:predicted TIM-barrel fold metal-dependent hydrolase